MISVVVVVVAVVVAAAAIVVVVVDVEMQEFVRWVDMRFPVYLNLEVMIANCSTLLNLYPLLDLQKSYLHWYYWYWCWYCGCDWVCSG